MKPTSLSHYFYTGINLFHLPLKKSLLSQKFFPSDFQLKQLRPVRH